MSNVIGDIHGQYTKLVSLLRNAELVDDTLSWKGGTTNLWFMGDFFDRGPDGIAVIDLVMRLQQEAQGAGGQVESLLGNHEVLILAAQRFGEQPSGGPTSGTVSTYLWWATTDTRAYTNPRYTARYLSSCLR
jgi:hypothetical protein